MPRRKTRETAEQREARERAEALSEIREDLRIMEADRLGSEILLCTGHLGEFVKAAWPILEPANPFVGGWHIDAICEHLEAVSRGHIRNLCINMPPRHMKSLAVSVFWPMWEWTWAPAIRWLYASYKMELGTRDSLKCRRLIESPWYQQRWGRIFRLTGDQNLKTRFENSETGYRITTTSGTGTGEGGDRIVVDDPHDIEGAVSDVQRESTLEWWDQTMSTRLNDPKRSTKVIVMQRLHEADLSGHVLKQGGYEHLMLPEEYEPERHCVTSLGWKDPRKHKGELLWPHRLGIPEVEDFKLRLGPTAYAGQFQQRPAPPGGGRFKADYFRSYKYDPLTDTFTLYSRLLDDVHKTVTGRDCRRFAVMDPAGIDPEQNEKPCYTVIQVWGLTPQSDMLLLDQWREMKETPEVAAQAVAMSRQWDCEFCAVEKNGLGLGVCQTIHRWGVAMLGINARGSKEDRSATAEIRMAAGTVYFPMQAVWRYDLEHELLFFPNGEYSDQADALSHACRLIADMKGPPAREEDTKAQEAKAAVPYVPVGRYKTRF